MSTCASNRLFAERLGSRNEPRGGRPQEAPGVLCGLLALSASGVGTMDSFGVVEEYDASAGPGPGPHEDLQSEEPMEPCVEETGGPNPSGLEDQGLRAVAPFRETREPQIKLNLSSRKLSLQERSQSVQSPGVNVGVNGRYIYPSLPYSPVTSPHSSPRLPRRPTIESHRVSITGLQVRDAFLKAGGCLECCKTHRTAPRWQALSWSLGGPCERADSAGVLFFPTRGPLELSVPT